MTGEQWVHDAPPLPSAPPPIQSPPSPPFSPFSTCQDACTLPPLKDWEKGRCRDGGRNSYSPSLCFYGTQVPTHSASTCASLSQPSSRSLQCQLCGIRSDSVVIEQDDSCHSANNGICEDGFTGSVTFLDAAGRETHLCGLGTDFTDCVMFGPRKVLSFGFESYAGVTNVTVPLPPPAPPPPPQPFLPPPSTTWVSATTGSARCYAFFSISTGSVPSKEFACSGTEDQIEAKKNMGICSHTFSQYNTDSKYIEYCSDGGYGSVLVQRGDMSDATSGCDYGSSPQACAQARPYKQWITHCSPPLRWGETPQNDRCSCADECGVGEDGDPVALYHPTDTEANGTAYCRDGGPNSQSSTCNYGTQ